MIEPLGHEPLHDVKLTTVRTAISPVCYRRSQVRNFAWLGFDFAIYLAAMWAVFAVESAWLKLAFGLVAGCGVAVMFIWAHDAAHGALFQSKLVAEVLGTISMLPSFNMYRLWSHGHNRVHHGFTSYTPIDWVWRPLTPAEYAALGRWRRFIYRLERTPYTCALHYLLKVWWPGMVRFRPDPKFRERHLFTFNKALTLVFAIVFCLVAYRFAGGIVGVVAAVVLPWIVFNYFIALFVFLHHTHPDVPFFDNRQEWSNSIGQVYCSIVVRCSRLSELLTHNIMIHVPHHVDPHIPFYRLKRAYADLERSYAAFIHEYRFRWSTVRRIFRRCKLYDYDLKRWYSLPEAAALTAHRGAAGPLPRL